jgi:hypothetical protein
MCPSGTQVAKDEHYANPEATFMKEITFRSNMRKTGTGEVSRNVTVFT